uniref:hypothetical protein n=1 Tax=Nocardia neocaledoniensis TaxID=236511 RepID=UPI0024546441
PPGPAGPLAGGLGGARGGAPRGVDMLPRLRESVVQVVAGDPADARDTPRGVLVVEKGGTRTELATQVVSLGAPAVRAG